MPRDNFSSTTKQRGALRVGYRCCFKGCGKITAAPADNDRKYQIDGVACHIYAAAPGGPRYNPNMTKDERISLDNLIWMCSNHSNQIDDDSSTYSADELKEWKRIMEEQTLKEYTSVGYFENKNPKEVEFIFEQLILSNEFDKLPLIFSQYKTSFGDEIDEIVLRYKVFYYAITYDKKYADAINEYFEKKYDGIQKITQFAIETGSIELIKEILSNKDLDDNLLKELSYICDNGFIKYISSYKDKKISFSINKLVTTASCEDCFFGVFKNSKGEDISYYSEKDFYCILANSILLNKSLFLEENLDAGRQLFEELYNLTIIRKLRTGFQIGIYGSLLRYLFYIKDDRFMELYDSLSDEVKNDKKILQLLYVYKIDNDLVNEDEIVSFCEKIDDYSSLMPYLLKLPADSRISFLNDRRYIFKKSSIILYAAYIDGLIDNSKVTDYSSYFDDVYYHTICCMANIDFDTHLQFLNENKHILPANLQCQFINFLIQNNQIKMALNHIDEIFNKSLQKYLVFSLQNFFSKNDDITKYCIKKLDEYLSIPESKDKFDVLCVKGNALMSLDFPEKAKETYLEAYSLNKKESLLENIVAIRINTDDYIKDEVFDDIIKLNSPASRWYIAKAYKNNGDVELAKQYLLDCYCMKFQQEAVCGEMFLLNISRDEDNLSFVDNDSVVTYEVAGVKRHIIFLKRYNNNLSYISDEYTIIANLKDSRYSKWKYKKIGINIIDSQEVNIIEIINVYSFISREGLQRVINDKKSIVFRGDNPKEALNEIKDFLIQKDKEKEKEINELMSLPVRLPMSYLIGWYKNDYGALIEIAFKKFEFRNNTNYLIKDFSSLKFILSPETIYILFKVNKNYPISFKNFCIPYECFEYYNNLINENLLNLDNPNDVGTLGVLGNELARFERDLNSKSIEYEYWNELKSFINGFEILKKYDSVNFEFDKTDNCLDNFKLEKSVITALVNNKTYVVCTEDNFLNHYCNIHELSNIGICSLLPFIVKKENFLKAINLLYTINFSDCMNKNVVKYLAEDIELYRDMVYNRKQDFDEKIHDKIMQTIVTNYMKDNPLLGSFLYNSSKYKK